MTEIARINDKVVDWNAIKKSLDKVKCIRQSHPACEGFCYTEAAAFKRISKLIREHKELVTELKELRSLAMDATEQCDKHWIRDCAECSAKGRIDRALAIAKKRLGKLRWSLINLPTVAEALGRKREQVTEFPSEIQAKSSPMAAESYKLYGREKTGFESQRLSKKDLNDNIRLIESWLKSRVA